MRIENSFIPVKGVGEQTERKLWQQGVTHWDAFDGTGIGRKLARRVDSYIDTARDHLDAENTQYFYDQFPVKSHWRLYENFESQACFLDIETTGLNQTYHDVTVVTIVQNGTTTTLVKDRDLTRASLMDSLGDARLFVTFNGKRFDIPFLETGFDISLDQPHLDLLYPCRRIGWTGGLKQIEHQLGISRDQPDLSGRDAVRLWHEYERGNTTALDTLVQYNQADTENLIALTDSVVTTLHEDVFEPANTRD